MAQFVSGNGANRIRQCIQRALNIGSALRGNSRWIRARDGDFTRVAHGYGGRGYVRSSYPPIDLAARNSPWPCRFWQAVATEHRVTRNAYRTKHFMQRLRIV